MTMTTGEMKRTARLGWTVLLACLALGLGCTKVGKSLIPVTIDASDARLPQLSGVMITVAQGSKTVAMVAFAQTPWPATKSVGVYVSADVTGSVTVSAYSKSDNVTVIAMSDQPATVDVTPGKDSPAVTLRLVPVPPGGGSGGAGGSGPGSGGAGGMVSGSGGLTGTGGVPGGTGGRGGTTPPGTGGMVMPGTGGLTMPGTGGMTTPGTGGTAGSGPGTGGAATGGAGNRGGGAGGMGAAGGKAGRAWQGATLAETNDTVDNYVPIFAVDGKGNIVAVYMHGSGLSAAYYDYSKGTWGAETAIDNSAMTSINETPTLAVDKNGNWLTVWQQDPDVPQHGIWQSTSTDGTHWSAPAAITTTGKLYEPVLAMNQDGTAVVAWTENVPPDNHFTMTASVRVNGTWTAPHVLLAGVDTGEHYAAVAVTSTGTAIVTWEQSDGTANDQLSVWQARFSGGTWSAASLVESYTGGQAYSANVATNNAGQAVLTWLQDTSSTIQLWAQRYPATGNPEAAMMVAEGGTIAWDPAPAVTLDDSGVATAAWAFQIKMKYNVHTSRAAWGQAWSAPLAMETDDEATNDQANSDDFAWVTSPALGHDAAGNVALTWRKRTGTRFDMWARNYDAAGATWGPGVLLETKNDNTLYAPAMAMGPSGVAVAGWYYGYEYDIWANVYR